MRKCFLLCKFYLFILVLLILFTHKISFALEESGTSLSRGLLAEYFDESNLTKLKIRKVDRIIDFDWGGGRPESSVSSNNFSIRWQGQILARCSGVHEFHLMSDDGVRLRIGDTIIINKWNKDITDATGKIYLKKSKKYPIILEYQEKQGLARVKLSWSCKPFFSEELIPPECLFPKTVEDGLRATYFEDKEFKEPTFTKIDKEIYFNWRKRDEFSVMWSGEIQAPKTGSYEFYLLSDGRVEMSVNNTKIMAEEVLKPSESRDIISYSGKIDLSYGQKYPIKIKYSHFDSTKEAVLELYWSINSSNKKKMTSIYLYPDEKTTATNDIVIFVDAKQKLGKFEHFWEKGVGSGHAALYLRDDMIEHLRDVKENIGFGYVRFHGILNDDVGIYRSKGAARPVFNWHNCDRIYDSIVSVNMWPFVEFGFMPEALASGKATVFYYKGNVTPPLNYDKWRELIYQCVKHWKERYGIDEIRKWKFEIWNEPNLIPGFWTGTQKEYFKLYDYAADAIKSVDRNLKVGGPASAGLGEWVEEFINHCKSGSYVLGKERVPLDFISTHGYPWDKGKWYDRDKNMAYPDWKYFYYGVREIYNKVKYSGIKNLKEIHITEWGPYDFAKVDSAPYICHILKDVYGFVDSFSFWTYTDIFEELGPVTTNELPGIFGLLNVHGIRKASYNVFLMLKMMGDERLQTNFTHPDIPEIEGWASSDSKKGSIQVMVWNYKHPNNKKVADREVKIKIRNIPFENARAKQYLIDENHGNLYSVWESMGKPERFSKSDLPKVKEKSKLPLTKEEIIVIKEGCFDFYLELPINSVSLIVLEPYRPSVLCTR